MPEVSIVIAAYCAEDSIAGAIRSALDQSVDLEVIVVDDASPDGTAEAAEAVGDDRVRVVRMPDNGGPGAARNAGFAAATGEFVAVLDATDAFRPGRLARCLKHRRDADILLDSITIDEEGAEPRTLDVSEAAGGPMLDLECYVRLNNPVACRDTLGYTKPLFRRTFLEENGLCYDTALRIGEDYLLMAEALACGGRCAVVAGEGYIYRRSADSISTQLDTRHIDAMLAADAAFEAHHTLPAPVVDALDARRSALLDALAYAEAVSCLKAWRVLSAVTTIARRPRSALHALEPIAARLQRVVRGDPQAASAR